MRRLPKLLARLLAVGLLASAFTVVTEPAIAVTAPQTLADRQPVRPGPVATDFPIQYLGVLWETERGPTHAAGPGEPSAGQAAARFRHGDSWGAWVPLVEDGIEVEGRWASGLLAANGADAYQVRGVPTDALGPRAVAINTTDGPPVTVGERLGGSAQAIDNSMCRSRADWGADESLRFDSEGNEIFPPAFYDAQAMTVHHTATENGDPDPAATIRAIYRYHAVDQGWGDIGYQYLIDESGIVYEGRWSGTTSDSCTDFAHEEGTDRMVTGAHTGGWNSGNLGVALLGEFTDHPRSGADPQPTAVESLENLLAELAVRHELDPTVPTTYVNPVSGEIISVQTVAGHRDYNATECPGERLYDQLPAIRLGVAAKMVATDGPPAVTVTHPADGTTVSGTIQVTAHATDDEGVASVSFAVDGNALGAADVDGSDGWSTGWDTRTVANGTHTLTASATDTAGQQTTSLSVSVVVGNTDGTLTMRVGDLDGTVTSERSRWQASVTVAVVDSAGGPVPGATVTGTWIEPARTASCTTGPDGRCSVVSGLVSKKTPSLTFTVDTITGSLTYDGENSDPDGDSDGTTITLAKP